MALTAEQRSFFEEQGFLVIEDLLTPEEVAVLRERTEAIASGRLTHVPERFLQVEPAIQRGEAMAATQRDSYRKLFHLAHFYLSSHSGNLPMEPESSREQEICGRPGYLWIQGRSFDFPRAV